MRRQPRLAQQHAQAVQDWTSLQQQDVYEEDAELDCNSYAGFLSQGHGYSTKQDGQQEEEQEKQDTIDEDQQKQDAIEEEQKKQDTIDDTIDEDGVLFVAREGRVQSSAFGPPKDFHARGERAPMFSCMAGCLPEQVLRIFAKPLF